MNCPKCETPSLRITHTLTMDKATMRRCQCSKCKRTYTLYQAILCEADRGNGAHSWVQRLASGAVAIELTVTSTEGQPSSE